MNQSQNNQQHYLVDKASTKMALGGLSLVFVGIGLVIFLLVARIILDFYQIEANKTNTAQLMVLVQQIIEQEAPNSLIATKGVELLDWAIFQTSGLYNDIEQMQKGAQTGLEADYMY